jgi:hypothetical protein
LAAKCLTAFLLPRLLVTADNASMGAMFISIICNGVASLFASLLIRAAIRVFK